MKFPLGFDDISFWLAVTSIILLVTSEFMNSNYGQIPIIIEKKHLRTTALILGFLFLSTVAIRIYQIIVTL